MHCKYLSIRHLAIPVIRALHSPVNSVVHTTQITLHANDRRAARSVAVPTRRGLIILVNVSGPIWKRDGYLRCTYNAIAQRVRYVPAPRAARARVSALRGRGWACVQVWRHVQVRGYWEAGRPPDACDATAPAGAEYALRVPPCAGVPE